VILLAIRTTRPTIDNPTTTANMSAPQLNKIAANSPSRQNPSELETAIAGALFDLESNTADLKAALRPLQIVSAREV
jgi:small subunit ribosomal protein S7e